MEKLLGLSLGEAEEILRSEGRNYSVTEIKPFFKGEEKDWPSEGKIMRVVRVRQAGPEAELVCCAVPDIN